MLCRIQMVNDLLLESCLECVSYKTLPCGTKCCVPQREIPNPPLGDLNIKTKIAKESLRKVRVL